MSFDKLSPEERLIPKQAVRNLQTLKRVACAAADTLVFAAAEKLAVEQRRELTRRTLHVSMVAAVPAQNDSLVLPQSIDRSTFRPNDSKNCAACDWPTTLFARSLRTMASL